MVLSEQSTAQLHTVPSVIATRYGKAYLVAARANTYGTPSIFDRIFDRIFDITYGTPSIFDRIFENTLLLGTSYIRRKYGKYRIKANVEYGADDLEYVYST